MKYSYIRGVFNNVFVFSSGLTKCGCVYSMNESECACSHCTLFILLKRHTGELMSVFSETNASFPFQQIYFD